MNYYRDQVPQELGTFTTAGQKYQFILIGGWAVWLYTHQLKSKDIDLLVKFDTLEKLRYDFPLTKNERLKNTRSPGTKSKLTFTFPLLPAGPDIDRTVIVDGFTVPRLKLSSPSLTAYRARQGSGKGLKT